MPDNELLRGTLQQEEAAYGQTPATEDGLPFEDLSAGEGPQEPPAHTRDTVAEFSRMLLPYSGTAREREWDGPVYVDGPPTPLIPKEAPKKRNDLPSFWTRAVAKMVDGFIIGAAYVAALLTAANISGTWVSGPVFFRMSGAAVLYPLVSAVYNVLTTSLMGGTVGKRALRMKVKDAKTKQAPSFWQIVFRETFAKLLSWFTLGVGFFMAFSAKGALHDRLADTAVEYDFL